MGYPPLCPVALKRALHLLKTGSNFNVVCTQIAGTMLELSAEKIKTQVAESKTQAAESKTQVVESMLAQETLKTQVAKLETQVAKLETQVSKLETQAYKVELANTNEKLATAKFADASIKSWQPQHTPAHRRVSEQSAIHEYQGEHVKAQDADVQHEVEEKNEPNVHRSSDNPTCAQDVHISATNSQDVDQSSEADPESSDKPYAPDRRHDASEQTKSVPAQFM